MSSFGHQNQGSGGDGGSSQQVSELREELKQRDQIIRRLKEEAQEKLSITREEANQVASGDLMAKDRECESLKSQIEVLTGKLATQETLLIQEKTKVKEVIQAQRDVRKSINASNSKRNADFSSPGRPEYGGTNIQSSAQNSRKNNIGGGNVSITM